MTNSEETVRGKEITRLAVNLNKTLDNKIRKHADLHGVTYTTALERYIKIADMVIGEEPQFGLVPLHTKTETAAIILL